MLAIWSNCFALCHALVTLVGFHMSGRCKIHAAMGIRSHCFPDGQACAYRLFVLKSCSTHWSEILDGSYCPYVCCLFKIRAYLCISPVILVRYYYQDFVDEMSASAGDISL